MKKGFTLSELLGVVVLLGSLALVIIPLSTKTLKEGKQKLHDEQIELIKASMATWTSVYQKPKNNEVITLTLYQLKESGLIDTKIIDPLTDENFPNDSILKIINKDNNLSYEVTIGSNTLSYDEMPYMKLNGDALEYIKLGEEYQEKGVVDINGEEILTVNSFNNTFNKNKVGIYLKEYSLTNNKIYRTIIVIDDEPPVISFTNNLTISTSQISNYNFLSDVTLSDNSGETVNATVSHNIVALSGTYTIKYTATDTSGNETIVYRDVLVTD